MGLSQTPIKLVRRNASKNFNYTPTNSSSESPSTSGSSAPRTRSLDFPHDKGITSFRIEGNDGELDLIFQTLGLSGPEDFDIPKDAYDRMMNRASSDVIPQPKMGNLGLDEPEVQKDESNKFVLPPPHRCGNVVRPNLAFEPDSSGQDWKQHTIPISPLNVSVPGIIGRGIKGDRPPTLTVPPPMTFPLDDDGGCSTWDRLKQLAPDNDRSPLQCRDNSSDDDVETDCENAIIEETNDVRCRETVIMSRSCSFTTSNDDDSSSTTTDPVSVISPNSGSRLHISHWEKGRQLGKGSFGTVYEGISRYFFSSNFLKSTCSCISKFFVSFLLPVALSPVSAVTS